MSKKSELDQFDFRTTWCRPLPPPASVLSKKIQAKFVKKKSKRRSARNFSASVCDRARTARRFKVGNHDIGFCSHSPPYLSPFLSYPCLAFSLFLLIVNSLPHSNTKVSHAPLHSTSLYLSASFPPSLTHTYPLDTSLHSLTLAPTCMLSFYLNLSPLLQPPGRAALSSCP